MSQAVDIIVPDEPQATTPSIVLLNLELDWLAGFVAQFCHLYGQHTAFADKELTALVQGNPSTQEILDFAHKRILADCFEQKQADSNA